MALLNSFSHALYTSVWYSKWKRLLSLFKIQNPNSEFGIQNSESKFRIRNSEFRFQDSEFVIQNCELSLKRKSEPFRPTNSLFPIKIIEKLDWTQSNIQQNKETITGCYNRNKSQKRINNYRTTTVEQTTAKTTGRGGG